MTDNKAKRINNTTMTLLADDYFAMLHALQRSERFAARWKSSPNPEAAREAERICKIIDKALKGGQG